jgi:F-type H+-transporting ATPase subunit epsilon
MKPFILHLQSATQYESIPNVVSFVGEDISGSFGIMGGHARMMTLQRVGLSRFRSLDGPWEYLALPGALLYFVHNQLFVSTRRYLRDTDYARISAVLETQLLTEEEDLRHMKESLHRLEEEMLRRLWKIERGEGTFP